MTIANDNHPAPSAANTGAVIAAAGSSSRMGGVDKIFALLAGRAVLAHSVAAFESHPRVGAAVIVLHPDSVDRGRALVHEMGWRKVAAVVAGGGRRQDSVAAGLDALPPTCGWVLVHDGARPCVTGDVIDRGIDAAEECGAAVAAAPVKDTIKVVDADGVVVETPDRAALWAVQTPQVFRLDLLRAAYAAYAANDDDVTDDVTDDAGLVEKLGHAVKVFHGSYDNIKVTTPEDLDVAAALLRRAAEAPA